MTGDEYRAEALRVGDLARRIYAEHEPLNAERATLAARGISNLTPEEKARLVELDHSPLYGYYMDVDRTARALFQMAEWADRQAAKL